MTSRRQRFRQPELQLKKSTSWEAAKDISKVTRRLDKYQNGLSGIECHYRRAARAGEAGKGFAVVAGEIKNLARQTADATNEISRKIAGAQVTTTDSVNAIEKIVGVINDINHIMTQVASAIEEQSATTQEISDNIGKAASGVNEVNDNMSQMSAVTGDVTRKITEVSQDAEALITGSRQVNDRAGELSSLMEELKQAQGKFRI